MMLEAATYLGTSLFFGLLILFFYRNTKKSTGPKQKQVTVPLRIDRTALLEGQRRVVADRRNRLKNDSEPKLPERVKPSKETQPAPISEETTDSGFGEDLGSALAMDQNQATTEKVKRKAGRSRFAALQDAADQFKEIYNRNSHL